MNDEISVIPRQVDAVQFVTAASQVTIRTNCYLLVSREDVESAAMNTQPSNALECDPIMERLEDGIGCYDQKSFINQHISEE